MEIKAEGPFCRDCQHRRDGKDGPHCREPKLIAALGLVRDLVTGGYHESQIGTCEKQRGVAGACGPEGKAFVLKWECFEVLAASSEATETDWWNSYMPAAITATLVGLAALAAVAAQVFAQ